jgi:hypothetical protein
MKSHGHVPCQLGEVDALTSLAMTRQHFFFNIYVGLIQPIIHYNPTN